MHRHDPGPKYEVELNMSKKSPDRNNPPRLIIKRDNIPTRITEIENESRKVPGPGRYDNAKKRKIYGTYTYKNFGGTFTDEALYRGMITPGHTYDAIDLEKIKNRASKFKYNKPNIDGPLTNRIGKIPKSDDPACTSYKDNEAFYKTTFVERTIKWPLSKSKRTTYTCEQADRKASLPAPSHYHPEKAHDSGTVTIGARGKLGYYAKI